MNFRDFLTSAEGTALVQSIVGSSSTNNLTVASAQQLKNKYAVLGKLVDGTVEGLVPSGATPITLTYNKANNTWYSPWETIFHYMLATGRATGAAAAVGTQVNVSNEQWVYRNFQQYLNAGLTAQLEMFSTGQSNTAGAFPISRFLAVKSSAASPTNVTSVTPAIVYSNTHSTGVIVSSAHSAGDVTVGGTGDHLWAQGAFEVGGVAATITGYFMHVRLRWRT